MSRGVAAAARRAAKTEGPSDNWMVLSNSDGVSKTTLPADDANYAGVEVSKGGTTYRSQRMRPM